jgi:hypothetical protein
MKDDTNFRSVRPFGFRAPRVATNFSFFLEVPATAMRYEAVCTDISEDGLAAELLETLDPKTLVKMRFLLPGATTPLHVQGQIEYSQDQRCGITFLYSSPEEQEQVQIFVQSIS